VENFASKFSKSVTSFVTVRIYSMPSIRPSISSKSINAEPVY